MTDHEEKVLLEAISLICYAASLTIYKDDLKLALALREYQGRLQVLAEHHTEEAGK